MTKSFRLLALVIFTIVLSVFLNACTDSDNFIFDEDNTSSIAVSAFMARSFDSTATKVKSDTIIHGDSILFIANVSPSKSIRTRESFWLMDGKFYASEFNVHDAIGMPGSHEIVFVLVTIFGDTLTDTLHLWVPSPPILDNKNFLPADESQNIPPQEGVQFAWNAYDIDSICTLHYHFVLTNLLDEQQSEPDLVDTIISTPYFNMNRELKPLSQYRWTVQAFNEYNVASTVSITSTFATSGIQDEGAIAGAIKMSNENQYATINLIVLDTNNNPLNIKDSIEKNPTTGKFEIKPLTPGKYKITAHCKSKPDYVADTILAKVNAGQITSIGVLHMTDNTPPTIKTLSGKDTLDFADSLQFIITDGSAENIISNAITYIGNRKVTQFSSEGKILSIPTFETDRSWIPQFVTIIATDGSGNTTTKSFAIRPSIFWFDTNNDTTISRQSQITISIHDHNPFSFVPNYFRINPNGDVKGTITLDANGKTSIKHVLDGEAFFRNEQEVVTTVFYTNGISQSRSWTIKINEPPFMSYEDNCVSPCNMFTSPNVVFKWKKANDPENDALLHRLNIVLGSDTISDTTQFFYRSDFVKSTLLRVKDIPEGPLFWWVEAKDPYGGISPVWKTKAQAIVLSEEDYEKLQNGEQNGNLSLEQNE